MYECILRPHATTYVFVDHYEQVITVESNDQAERFPRLTAQRAQQAHKEAVFELLLCWFAYTFFIGCGGVLLGLIYASGGSIQQLMFRSFSSLSTVPLSVIFVVGGAYALTRKTLSLGSMDNGAP